MIPRFSKWLSRSSSERCSRSFVIPTTQRQFNLEVLEERVNPSLGFGFAVGGGDSDSFTRAVATDSAGNSYITGDFSGTADIGGQTVQAKGTADAFVAKFNGSGALDWLDDLGGSGATVEGDAIAVDNSGNVYTTGFFHGTNVNFDPNADDDQLSSSNSGTYDDAYVSKLNSSGHYVFGVELGFGGDAFGYGIAVDGSGNVYTTGVFSGTDLNFNPNFGSNDQLSSSTSGNDANAYVSKLNSSGQYAFAVDLG
jgi:hypothetical protein